MIICKNCGVELEKDMKYCPICGKAVRGPGNVTGAADRQKAAFSSKMNLGRVRRFFSWFKRTFHV